MATRDTIEEKRLNEGELEIVQRHLDGQSIRESARIIGVSHGTVWQTLKRPHVAAYIERLRADAEDALRRRMLAAGPEAFDVLLDVARGGDTSAARVSAAKAILDRVLPGMPEVAVQTNVQVNFASAKDLTDEQLRAIAGED